MLTSVGFIGLGNIGSPMAMNLLKGAFDVWVYDVMPDACKALVDAGANQAKSVAELAAKCQMIGLCVRDDQDVIDVMSEILEKPDNVQVVAIHSTVKPETIIEQNALSVEKGFSVIDAPITGGASGAAAAELCYIVGGDAESLTLCRPVFETSAKDIIHAGALGQGMIAKLCNNLITYAEFTAFYEAMKLAEAAGLDKQVVKQVGQANGNITHQMLQFSVLHDFKPDMAPEDFQQFAGSFAQVAEKDLALALAVAEKERLSLPNCEKSLELISQVYQDSYE